MRSFRKALELLVVYIVLIIGIFILQFRTDSNIIEKIGNLQVTLARLENSDNPKLLQNKLQISYNGLNFHSDDQTSAKYVQKGSTSAKNLKLVSYEANPEENKIRFLFSNDVALRFEIAGTEPEAPLSIFAELPSDIDSVYLPYNLSYSLKVSKEEANRLILNSKKLQWAFTSNQISDGMICMTSKEASAHLATYDDTKKFSLDSITELAQASEEMYNNTVNNFVNNMISLFKNALAENSYSEQEVVAYVAARSEAGRYSEAIEEIPTSFKKGNKRTYLSAPYFNNLSEMNATLDRTIKESKSEISASANGNNLDIFTTVNLASLLCIHENKEEVTAILERAASTELAQASISIVSGIIRTYVNLVAYESPYAELLQPAISKCFTKLENSCAIEDNKLVINDNGQFISVTQALYTGLAVMRYGEIIENPTYKKIGYAIINTYLADTNLDLRSSATLYPLIKYNNWYYPHFKVVNPDQDDYMWAWTCAENITQERDADDNLTLNVDFPLGYIHYLIVKGLPRFSSIYIYDMAFRTDPRFESYNSSGYVYKEDTMSLLLKSRQKSQIEKVKMYYTGLPSRKSAARAEQTAAEEAPKPRPKPAQKSSVVLGVSDNLSAKKKKAIIAAIMSVRPDLTEADAKKLFDSAPTTILDNVTKEEADNAKLKLLNAGANVN